MSPTPAAARIPTVLDALVLLCRNALPDWEVIDGPPAQIDGYPPDCLFVGSLNNDDETVSIEEDDLPSLGGRTKLTARVHCDIASWTGDGPEVQSALRAKVATALGAIAQALMDDSTLGGVAQKVSLRSLSWHALLTGTTMVGARFYIVVTLL